jgi:hypothetical protein
MDFGFIAEPFGFDKKLLVVSPFDLAQDWRWLLVVIK